MAAVDGQGTFPNLPNPTNDEAGRVILVANLALAKDLPGNSAGKETYWRALLEQANGFLTNVAIAP